MIHQTTESFLDTLEIVPATLADYKKLATYHYCSDTVRPTMQIYKVRVKAPNTDQFPDPIAINVFKLPLPNLKARNIATQGYFLQPETPSERLKLVNKKIIYAARLIVDPRFRRLGIATLLVRDGLERQNRPIVETMTPLDFTNKMLQKQGFQLYRNPAPKWYDKFTDSLLRIGLTHQSFSCPAVVHHRLIHLDKTDRTTIEKRIRVFMGHFRHLQNMPCSLERTVAFLSKIPYPQAYLIWHNPRAPKFSENPGDTDNKVEERERAGKKTIKTIQRDRDNTT